MHLKLTSRFAQKSKSPAFIRCLSLFYFIFGIFLTGCNDQSDTIYSGRVQYVSYKDLDDKSVRTVNRFDFTPTGSNFTETNTDVWVDVFKSEWVAIKILGMNGVATQRLIPKNRILEINIGNEKTNLLNIPWKKPEESIH